MALIALVAVLLVAMGRDVAPEQVRALGFVMLAGLNLVLIFVNRTFGLSMLAAFVRPNRALSMAIGIVALVLTTILVWPTARGFFALGPLRGDDLALCAGGLALCLAALLLMHRAWGARLGSSA